LKESVTKDAGKKENLINDKAKEVVKSKPKAKE